jgi:hypothetical protein
MASSFAVAGWWDGARWLLSLWILCRKDAVHSLLFDIGSI